jgi:hypothetical protein
MRGSDNDVDEVRVEPAPGLFARRGSSRRGVGNPACVDGGVLATDSPRELKMAQIQGLSCDLLFRSWEVVHTVPMLAAPRCRL